MSPNTELGRDIDTISSHTPAFFVPTESALLKRSSSVEDTRLGKAFQREDQSLPDCLTKDFLLFPKQKVHNVLYLQDIIHTIESVTILSCFIEKTFYPLFLILASSSCEFKLDYFNLQLHFEYIGSD